MGNELIKRTLGLLVMIVAGIICANAQIGYQVALINNATGEPRALETVTVEISISNNEGKSIYSGSQTATTNDFGILSLSVGNANTFKDADWGKLPFFISAKVDGILIGKSEILSVPVAEYAKKTGVLTVENLCKAPFYWNKTDNFGNSWNYSLIFHEDGTGDSRQIMKSSYGVDRGTYPFRWYMDSNFITIFYDDKEDGDRVFLLKYIPDIDALWMDEHIYTR